MKGLLLWLIRFYRRYISPAFPPCCRFIPTCSMADYQDAFQKQGKNGEGGDPVNGEEE